MIYFSSSHTLNIIQFSLLQLLVLVEISTSLNVVVFSQANKHRNVASKDKQIKQYTVTYSSLFAASRSIQAIWYAVV